MLVLGLGAWIYSRATTFVGARGRYALSGFAVLLAGVHEFANFGRLPASASSTDITAIVQLIRPAAQGIRTRRNTGLLTRSSICIRIAREQTAKGSVQGRIAQQRDRPHSTLAD